MATQAFLDAFRSGGGGLRHLILLAVPRDAVTLTDYLYLSDSEIGTLGGVVPGIGSGKFWQSAVLNFGPIVHPGAFCDTSVGLCTTSVSLSADNRITLADGTATSLRAMLATHVMTNASVTFYRIITSLGASGDAQMFGGFRVVSVELDGDELRLQLRQRVDWNKPVATRYVNKQEYPRAPDDTVGLPLPVVYGALSGLGLRRPWDSPFGLSYFRSNMLRPNKRCARAVLVDSGRGAGQAQNPAAKVLIASHACKSIVDTSIGTIMYMGETGRTLMLEAGAGDVINTSTEAGLKLADAFNYGWQGDPPLRVNNPTNGALNARHVLDPSDATYAYLDVAGSYLNLEWVHGAGEFVMGAVADQALVVGYQTSAVCTGLGFFMPGATPAPYGFQVLLPPSVAATVLWHPISAALPPPFDYTWQIRLSADTGQAAAGSAKIFFVGWAIKIRPNEVIIATERFLGRYRTVYRPANEGRKLLMRPFDEPVIEPAVTELQGQFFGNVHGHFDDGSGTYTGTASALIERMPDIMRHLLVTYGGESASNIETGSATGNFIDARLLMVDERGVAMKYGLAVSATTDVMGALADLGASGFVLPLLSSYDNKWKLSVWRTAPSVTYPWAFSRWDVVDEMGPKVEHTQLPGIVTGLRVAYGQNAITTSYSSEVALAYNRSVAGHEYFGLRDQLLTVTTGVNDRLNFKQTHSGATIYTMTLTGGDYATPHALAKHITTRMRAASADNHLISVCNVIEEGFNDRLNYTLGGSYAGIKPGTYATMEALRREAQRALNQSSSITGCSFAATSRTITPGDVNMLDFLMAGQPMGGTSIPAGATIVSVGATTFTISADTLGVGSGLTLTAYFIASWAISSFTVTLANPAWALKFTRGMRVAGIGISGSAIITTVNDATGVLTISIATTLAGNNANVQSLSSTGNQWLLRYQNGKFGVSKSAGTPSLMGYRAAGNVSRLDNAWGVLGFSRLVVDFIVPTTPTYANADDVRFEDHLCLISLESTTDLLLSTGADGQDSAVASRHCGDLLGISGDNDYLQSGFATHGMTCFFTPKGNREIALRRTASRYGARRELEYEGRAIYDTRTALSLRNRIADLLGTPRTTVTFNTTKAPDIERGDVFQFRSDMNDFVPYPGLGSDGLWTGKRFVVVEVVHHLGPSSRDTTIVAVDVTT